ncbi:MAG: NTP transferase domain-containing protein [Lentisphaeria bacterium]|nr:NTP transferase domain-containing protein [Lentisphaeria bacterium]
MKCLILAAGYATRLYPLTENFPKPLLEVKGKTILDWLVDDIDTCRLVDQYVIVSNHKFVHHFEDWVKTKAQNITVLDDGTSKNETRLGAVKDIQFVIDELKLDDDLLIIAGDNVLDFSLGKFIQYALEKKTSCIMRYYEPSFKRLQKSGVVVIGEEDRVIGMKEKPEKPESTWCCPPFYFIAKKDVPLVARGIMAGCGTDAPGSFIAWLYKQVAVHAMEMPGKRYDIGSLENYEQIKQSYNGIK